MNRTNRWVELFLASMLACLLALPLHAQPSRGKKYAVLVGVATYDDKVTFGKLDFPENDVEELAKVLRGPRGGFDSVVVLSTREGEKPTAVNIRKAIAEMLKKATAKDTVLIGLAGHGIQMNLKDPEEKETSKNFPCFCPADASDKKVKFSTCECQFLLNLDHLIRDMGECKASAKVLLVDACRNEHEAIATERKVIADLPKNLGILFSCSRDERAWETAKLGKKGHGVFFYHVIEGLKGEAGKDEVGWDELTGYVKRKVNKDVPVLIGGGARQTPHSIGSISGTVILARGGASDAGVTGVVNSIGMKLMPIEAGTFLMGSAQETGRYADEALHQVKISRPFHMGTHEVTQAEYEKVMGSNPSAFSATGANKTLVQGIKTDRFPVENVTWHDAKMFCDRLSALPEEKKAGRVYRLPTEAEWEYACRAGTRTPTCFGQVLGGSQANFNGGIPYGGAAKGAYLKRTTTVGSYEPNPWGLFDMHGNVLEWCADWYGEGYYSRREKDDPQGPATGKLRVIRGGYWRGAGMMCRSACRNSCAPEKKSAIIGFRVVCEIADGK